MIIGLTGLAGSGKSSVANILHKYNKDKFVIISFGSALKDTVAAMFGWDRELLEGDTVESREWRETVDEYWASKLGPTCTPRKVLQVIGTDIIRNVFEENFWIYRAEKTIKELTDKGYNVVIPDVRFKNEVTMLESMGAELWDIRLGELPEWYEAAGEYNKGLTESFDYPDIHKSEMDIVGFGERKHIIHMQDRGLDKLKEEVIKILVDKE